MSRLRKVRFVGVGIMVAATIGSAGCSPAGGASERNAVFAGSWYPGSEKQLAVDVDRLMDRKWGAIDAMTSQMYEWGPWLGGSLDQVPVGAAERLEWLQKRWSGGFLRWKDRFGDLVAERYGKDHAEKVRYVEVFELCEYGRRPSRAELWKLFPK